MTAAPARESIDLAVVTNDLPRMAAFYRDVVGLADLGEMPTRTSTGGTVRRLRCGTSELKLISYRPPVPDPTQPAGTHGTTGYRYWTIHVTNLDEILATCTRAEVGVVRPVREIGAGVRIAIVADPDGNWVEFLQTDRPENTP